MRTVPSDQTIALAVQHALPQARSAWLFGSAARRQSLDADSDLDIAVALPQKLESAQRMCVAEQIAGQLGFDVDLLDFTRLHTVMQYQVLATGRLLFDHTPARTVDYAAFVASEYQNIQAWRQPMIQRLTHRLAHS